MAGSKCRRLSGVAAAAIVLSWAAGVSGAAAQTHVVVAGSGELGERILGQVNDLPIVCRLGPPLESNSLHASQSRAVETDADVVVSWHESESFIALNLFDRRSGRMVTRRLVLHQSGSPEERSATLEAAALIVRGGLRDILAERANGPPSQFTPAGTSPGQGGAVGSAPPGSEVDPSGSGPVSGGPPPAAPIVLEARLGWRFGIDGRASAGIQSPSIRLGAAWRRVRFGLTGGVSLPAKTADELAEVTVIATRANLGADVDLLSDPEWGVTLGGGVGGGFWHRSTRGLGPTVIATEDHWSTSVLIALRLGLETVPAALGGVLGLFLEAGVDVLPTAPRFVYETAGGQVQSALWNVQPWIRLSVGARGPRS